MKKTESILLAAVLLLSLCGCGFSGGSDNEFRARINVVGSGVITVTPDELSSQYRISDTFIVTVGGDTSIKDTDGNAIGADFLTAGLEVTIKYDGAVTGTDPARITAEAITLTNGVVSNSNEGSGEETITFSVDGETETVKADRVALKACCILVPSEGWKSKSAQDTQVGPVVINPDDNTEAALTFRVHADTDIKDVRELLEKQYSGLVWAAWDNDAADGGAYRAQRTADGLFIAVYTAKIGNDTVSILCRCPESAAGSWGVRLCAIAETLRAN
jgi:hypothetical protein